MKAVVQRVKESTVTVDGKTVGQIKDGLLVLLGIGHDDTSKDCDYLVDKIIHLRIFEDDHGKMNRSLVDTTGELLIVSQFTLMGDCRKGRRPSFSKAALPSIAEELYLIFVESCRKKGVSTQTGKFGATMNVKLINSGPVTFILDSSLP